jgi:hypothetical protein
MATAYQQGQGPPPPGGPPGGGIPDSYFTESKKGEINELRTLLRGFASERDPQRKRDIMKKVIAYMTLGIDVSRLFTEMMYVETMTNTNSQSHECPRSCSPSLAYFDSAGWPLKREILSLKKWSTST